MLEEVTQILKYNADECCTMRGIKKSLCNIAFIIGLRKNNV